MDLLVPIRKTPLTACPALLQGTCQRQIVLLVKKIRNKLDAVVVDGQIYS